MERLGPLARVLSAQSRLPVFLAAVVLLALALRVIVVSLLIHTVSSQSINYNDFGWESWEVGWTARSIFLGQGFSSPYLQATGPTALVPPLYTYLLAGIFHYFGLNTIRSAFVVLTFNSVCSALTCIPLYFLTRNALNDRLARFVGIAWAVYPFAIYFAAARVWDYSVTALLFTCVLVLAQKLHQRGWAAWAGFGALYGLAALSNPSVVSLLPFLLGFAVWKLVRNGNRQWVMFALVACVSFGAVLTPWQIRNERVMHSHFFIRDGLAAEAYAGNNGDTHESNSAWTHPASNPAEMVKYKQQGEVAYMAEKRGLVLNFVEHHPMFFVTATARRVLRFWTGYWSFRPQYLKYEPFDLPNVPFCIFLLIFMIRGLIRWWGDQRSELWPYLAALLIFPLPYYLTHSSMDYRQPLEPIIIMLVVVGMFGTSATAPVEDESLAFDGDSGLALA